MLDPVETQVELVAVVSRGNRYVAGSAQIMGHPSSRTLQDPPVTITRSPDGWIYFTVAVEVRRRWYVVRGSPIFNTKSSRRTLQDVPASR